jgi:cell division protein FtsB
MAERQRGGSAEPGGGPGASSRSGRPGGDRPPPPAAVSPEGVARPPAAARGRQQLTSRAAVLAVVLCAVALSLAYPVREYVAQRRQIDQLTAQHQIEEAQVRSLAAEAQRLADPAYVEGQARAQLHMCLPRETCYVIIGGSQPGTPARRVTDRRSPWYVTLWQSVQQADRQAPR